MKKHRVMTIFGAGSALAAAVAIAVSLGNFGGHSRVEAAAIFQSWREAVTRAFSLKLTNIKHDGFTVDGSMQMTLPPNAQSDDVDPDQFKAAMNLHVTADQNADDLAGLNVDLALGAESGNEWAYIKLTQLPAELQNEPMAVMLGNMARNGLVVDLEGMLLSNVFAPTAFVSEEHSEGDDGDGPSRHLNIGIEIGNSNSADEGTHHPHGEHHVEVLNMGGHIHVGHDANNGNDDAGSGQNNQDSGGSTLNGHDFSVVTDWLKGVFDGTLTGEQMAAMVSHIEQAAQDVSVSQLADGGFSLIARNFNHPGNGLDADEQAILQALEIEIRYAESTGVQWVELRNLGDAAGSIRFDRLEDGIDATLLDRSRYTAGGNVPVFPLAGFANMVHAHHGAGNDNANNNSADGAGEPAQP